MNDEKIQEFIKAMAGQFQAGREIIAAFRNSLTLNKVWVETNNTINRDIDSFCVEAARWFGPEFNEKEFREIVYSF